MTTSKLARFWAERYAKDNQYCIVHENFTPNFNEPRVTRKFYARHEKLNFDEADPVLVERIETLEARGPRDIYTWPVTENQWYGWFLNPDVPIKWNHDKLCFPRHSHEMIRHELRIKMDKSSQRSKAGRIAL